MSFKCKICGTSLKRGSGHIKAKHGISTLEYVTQYEGVDITSLYLSGLSAQDISLHIKHRVSGISPIKKDILKYLREKGVEVRNTSRAMKVWNEKNGGVWNKGLTKEDHPSIARQAAKVKGKNNSYYKMAEESRAKTRWWEYKEADEIAQIRQKMGETLKKKIRNGEVVPYHYLNPEWAKYNLERRMEGYKQWQMDGNKVKFGNCSLMEKRIAGFLDELGYKYIRQKSFGRYRYDYCLEEQKLVIEYNGDYWHCNPKLYEKEYVNLKKGKTAKEIWEYDKIKLDLAIEKGYDVIVFWENDFKRLTNREIVEEINEAIKSKVHHKASKR